MAARQDPEIKADVIAELEDVQAPVGGRNVLDALMVEDIKVDRGLVSLVMVHPDERLAQDQEPLKNALEKALASIDGVAGVIVTHLSRSEMKARDPLAWFGDEAQEDAAPKAPKKERPSGGGLTLNALLKGAGCSADDVDVPLIEEDEPASAPLSLYSGGGCAAGNTEVTLAAVDQARKEAKVTPPSVAPVVKSAPVVPAPVVQAPVVTPASFVAPPASSAPVKPSAAAAQDVGAGNVVIDRWTYERLLAAERELSLRPSFEDHQALLVKVAALEARLQTLREVMRGLLG